MKPPCLTLQCCGQYSEPPQDCHQHVAIPMPFTHEVLYTRLANIGWFLTIITPPGEDPPCMHVLCKKCGEAVLPAAFIELARQHAPS